MATLQLPNVDARLAYLALQYHLSRPGSELQRETGGPPSPGLATLAPELESQLELAVVTVELVDEQRERLSSAIAGAINELKSTSLLAAGGRATMVPAFRESLRRLFPAAADDPDEAVRLAGHMLALRRRLDEQPSAATEERPQEARKPRWRFWQRG
jgi:hypothetical protein